MYQTYPMSNALAPSLPSAASYKVTIRSSNKIHIRAPLVEVHSSVLHQFELVLKSHIILRCKADIQTGMTFVNAVDYKYKNQKKSVRIRGSQEPSTLG